MENINLKLNIQSETSKLEAVLMHFPGAEVENMTPRNAQRALYSDILNLSIAQKEYNQIHGVLNKTSKVYNLHEMLTGVLTHDFLKKDLIHQICKNENAEKYEEVLLDFAPNELAKILIEGLPASINTLTDFLKDEFYALKPLYNFYFTRDAAAIIGNNAVVCKMANNVRQRESLIMNAIFASDLFFEGNIVDMNQSTISYDNYTIEGGDILVARKDILLVGIGARTTPGAIDNLIAQLCKNDKSKQHIVVQQLPLSPESFIHLDMVFTFLDHNKAMVYKPLILDHSPFQTVHIQIDNGRVTKITSVDGIVSVLKQLGMEIEPVICGGKADDWDQEREQWHSGANFLAIAPGKVLSYARNIHTLEELNKNHFDIVSANEVIEGKYDVTNKDKKCVITIEGSELPRGGGGPRCMTMPLRRS